MGNVKGTGLVQVVKALRSRREASLEVLPERLHPYLDRQVLASSWYPEEDSFALLRALATQRAADGDDVWEALGRASASDDLAGIYSSMVQRGNPWATLQRLPRLWRLYHDSGRLEVGVHGDKAARLELRDFPLADDDYCRLVSGYVAALLALAGAQEVEVRCLEPPAAGRPPRWDVRWS